MLRLKNNSSGKIDTVFILGLFTMFVATSFLLILVGMKQFNFTQEISDKNYTERTVSSYLQEKIRQHDVAGAVEVTTIGDCTALALHSTEHDTTFITYIYCYEGSLRELVVTDKSVYSLSSGQKIMELSGFIPEFISDALIKIEITQTDSTLQTLYISLNSKVGKEGP